VMDVSDSFVQIERTALTVDHRLRTIIRPGMVCRRRRVFAFLQRNFASVRSSAARARGFCGYESSQNDKSQDGNQNNIPAPGSCRITESRRD